MIYFDNAATTRPSETAISKASKFNNELFFNPSTLYSGGLNCAREIRQAKESILRSLGNTNFDVVFTSCGSESNNTAIFCAVKRGVYVTDLGEHAAVYKPFLELKQRGNKVFFVGLNKDGTVKKEELFKTVKENNADFVSIMHVNNETGGINDVNSIAKTLKSINNKIVFHVDGVQAFGKIPYRLSPEIDLYSISAHKVNGLKGVGALLKKKNLSLSPLIFGGGQESGYRSGTENIFGIKVFQYALEENYKDLKLKFDNCKKIKDTLINLLDKDDIEILCGENSSPYILTIAVKGLRGEVIMHALEMENVIVGNGSACSSRNRYSRVIEACGFSTDILDGVIRLSFSKENTIEQAIDAAKIINETVKTLKRKLL